MRKCVMCNGIIVPMPEVDKISGGQSQICKSCFYDTVEKFRKYAREYAN